MGERSWLVGLVALGCEVYTGYMYAMRVVCGQTYDVPRRVMVNGACMEHEKGTTAFVVHGSSYS